MRSGTSRLLSETDPELFIGHHVRNRSGSVKQMFSRNG
jgi:hypothetical protein